MALVAEPRVQRDPRNGCRRRQQHLRRQPYTGARAIRVCGHADVTSERTAEMRLVQARDRGGLAQRNALVPRKAVDHASQPGRTLRRSLGGPAQRIVQSHHCRAKLAAVTVERSHDIAHRVLHRSEIQRDAPTTQACRPRAVRQLDVETTRVAGEPVRMFLGGVVNDDAAVAAERGNHIAHLDVRAA